ncbi:hypothetical protein [Streptomyces sp. NPDC001833]|uniref:hypothetical protein n=1 Tax=Streptomyces sp. NPDC001833 TaxID=3154658 RepID=UPI003330F3DA
MTSDSFNDFLEAGPQITFAELAAQLEERAKTARASQTVSVLPWAPSPLTMMPPRVPALWL